MKSRFRSQQRVAFDRHQVLSLEVASSYKDERSEAHQETKGFGEIAISKLSVASTRNSVAFFTNSTCSAKAEDSMMNLPGRTEE
eukprot:3959713-Prymnesium_polylepis.1